MRPEIARRMWRLLEPYHAVVYFAPEVKDAYREAGLKGGWMGYFASRAAAMGPASREVVTATFFNFAPGMVARAIPDAWSFSTPERALAARRGIVAAALPRLLGDDAHSPAVVEAVGLLRRGVEGCAPGGRPLFAAHAALAWPEEPHLALWHAATVLREHRGDGHVAALVGAGLDGCEALVLQAATGRVPRESLQPFRGWTEDEWAASEERLRVRGWIEDGARASATGFARRAEIEDVTDEAALAPWTTLGEEDCARLEELLEPLSLRIVESGGVPFPNAIGVPGPGS